MNGIVMKLQKLQTIFIVRTKGIKKNITKVAQRALQLALEIVNTDCD